MTWRHRGPETESIYRAIAVIFVIHAIITAYIIAGSERVTQPTEAQKLKAMTEAAAMVQARWESRARATQEVKR